MHSGFPPYLYEQEIFSYLKPQKLSTRFDCISMKNIWPLILCTIAFCIACSNRKQSPEVSTLAGNGKMGSADGIGTEASFANLMGLTVDSNGDIYVADSHNNLIRKIRKDGTVTTVAGSGAVGSSDGRGIKASFFNPTGIAVDKNGFLYVADTHNSLIRKISPDGEVSTLAGRRPDSLQRGAEKLVKFDHPSGIAVDSKGNVFVADWANDVIRKISPDGIVTDFAGRLGTPGSKDGLALSASFYLPGGVAVDSTGNVYVADTYNNMIRKISSAGEVISFAGSKLKGSADGIGKNAGFSHPAGIVMDKQGNLFVADVDNNKIRKISPAAEVTTFAGSGLRGSKNGQSKMASFYRPFGVTVDAAGTVYVADYLNNKVRKISY
jgi:sugar lactone lactonase YvrE